MPAPVVACLRFASTTKLAWVGAGDPCSGYRLGGSNEWTNVGPDGGAIRLTIDPHDPNTFYAGTDTGLFKSNDRGAGWSVIRLMNSAAGT
jgi:hypothetical protein